MKRVILLLVLILLISLVYSFAAVPCKINYQGRLIKDNVPVDNPTGVPMVFNVDGKQVYSGNVPVYNGLFRVVLDLEDKGIDWTAGETKYLEVIVDGEQLSPSEPLYAYPYAINSHLLEGATKEYFLNTSGETQKKDGGLNIMGNVGIGTTTPGQKLTVSRSGAGQILRLEGGAVDWSKFSFGSSASLGLTISSDQSSEIFSIHGMAPTGSFLILPTGNVGIATTSPGAKLEVNGNIVANPTYGVVERTTSWTTASKTWVDIPNFTATITTHGKPVLITANINYNPVESEGSSGQSAAAFTIFRDGINLGDSARGLQVGSSYSGLGYNENVSMVYIDTPAAGTHNYTVGVKSVYDTIEVCEWGAKIQLAAVELN